MLSLLRKKEISSFNISNDSVGDLVNMTKNFSAHFYNSGVSIDYNVYMQNTVVSSPILTNIGTIVEKEGVNQSFFLNAVQVEKFKELRSGGHSKRISKNGFEYNYSQGKMSQFDSLDAPGRTMLTSEGTVNRSSHIIKDPKQDKLRFITPIEAERLNGFPDNWTDTGMTKNQRYFCNG